MGRIDTLRNIFDGSNFVDIGISLHLCMCVCVYVRMRVPAHMPIYLSVRVRRERERVSRGVAAMQISETIKSNLINHVIGNLSTLSSVVLPTRAIVQSESRVSNVIMAISILPSMMTTVKLSLHDLLIINAFID